MSRVVILISMIYTYTLPVHGRMPRPQNKFHNTVGGFLENERNDVYGH